MFYVLYYFISCLSLWGNSCSFFHFFSQIICQLPSNAQKVEITSPNTQNMELTNPNLSQFIPIYTNLPQLIQFFQIFNLSKLSFSFFFLETFFLTSKFCDLLIWKFAIWLNICSMICHLVQFLISTIFTCRNFPFPVKTWFYASCNIN